MKENFINKTFCLNTIILWSNTIVDHFHFTKDIFASKISSYIWNGSMISSCKRRIGRNSEWGDEETKNHFCWFTIADSREHSNGKRERCTLQHSSFSLIHNLFLWKFASQRIIQTISSIFYRSYYMLQPETLVYSTINVALCQKICLQL